MITPDDLPLTRRARDAIYLMFVVLRWLGCAHPNTYWANGVTGYRCPCCGANGYSGSPLFRSGFRSY